MTRLINRNVAGAERRTSMRLEPELWAALEEICHREDKTLAELVQEAKPNKRGRMVDG